MRNEHRELKWRDWRMLNFYTFLKTKKVLAQCHYVALTKDSGVCSLL